MKKIKIIMITLLLLTVLPLSVCADDSVRNSANVVIFAYFSDDSQDSADAYFNQKYAQIKKFYDGDYKRSLKSYLNTVSYGKYNVINYFPQDTNGNIISLPLNMSIEEAKNGMVDGSIIHAICEYFKDKSLAGVDLNNDGYIDNISIILKAENVSSVSSGTTLVPHSNTAGAINDESLFGLRISNFNMLNTERMFGTGYFGEETGLIIHEYMHTLNYPDLYNANGDPLVGFWDIMASVSSRPSLPLAYLRNKISGWCDIGTITQSGSYTLEEQLSGNGIKAYVISSPLNENEEFVLEYRKTPSDRYDENSLDANNVNELGLIVCRIDKSTAKDFYTNKDTNSGVYVLRPTDSDDLLKAALSLESGRTTTEGIMPLTFSDGTDSGIVISNVGSAKNDTISFDVTIPDNSQTDLWKSLNFPSISNNSSNDITIENHNNTLYAVVYENKVFKTFKFLNDNWQQLVNGMSSNGYVSRKLLSHDNDLYFLYTDYTNGLTINKLVGDNWTTIATLSSATGYMDASFINGDLYVVYAAIDGAYYSVFNGTSLSSPVKYESTKDYFCGDTKIVNVNSVPYLFVRNGIGDVLGAYKIENNNLIKISNGSLLVNTYDVKTYGNTIYVSNSVSGKTLQVSRYSNDNWTTVTSDIASYESTLSIHNGNTYVITSPSTGSGSIQMYVYDEGSNKFVMEGDANIDSASSKFTTLVLDNDIYLSYIRNSDNKAIVRRKTINSSNITKIDINNAIITKYENFDESNPNINVIYNGSDLIEGVDYNQSITNNTGVITISINGINKYTGNITKQYKNIDKLSITCKDAPYTGSEVYPEVTVTDGTTTLVKDKDYTLTYSNNTNVGEDAKVTVTGINDYYGTKEIKFQIYNELNLKLSSISLTLDGLINFNFYFSLPDEIINDKDAYVLFTLPDGRQETKYVKDARVNDKGYRGLYCGVYSMEMTEKVKAQLFTGNGVGSKVFYYSIEDYVNIIEGMPSNASVMPLLNSMLNYGGYSQDLFNYNLENKAYKNVKDNYLSEMNSLTYNDFDVYKPTVTKNDDNVSAKSVTLELYNGTTLRIYFNIKDISKVDASSIKIDDKSATLSKNSKGYYLDIKDIKSYKLDEYHTFEVGGNKVEACALSYVYSSLKYDIAPDVSKALYLYFVESKNYFKL